MFDVSHPGLSVSSSAGGLANVLHYAEQIISSESYCASLLSIKGQEMYFYKPFLKKT